MRGMFEFSGLPISIHALHEEGDLDGSVSIRVTAGFLSTPSMRRATSASMRRRQFWSCISIHALHEEGDSQLLVQDAPQ